MNFIQQAYKGANNLGTYVGSIILLFIGWQIIGVIPLTVVAFSYAGSLDKFAEAGKSNFMNIGINSNLFLILMIFSFFCALATLFFCIKFIHKRKIKTVITTRDKIDWKRVFFSFGWWFGIVMLLIVIDYFLFPEHYIWNFKLVPFTILCIISFLLLPIQTSMEEVFVRGYLMQGFGTWFKRPWMALVVTSVIFGLLHFANPEVEKLGNITMVYYIGTGLVLGLMTLLDEGMELALGFHAANNIASAILVTTSWSALQTEALLVDTSEPSLGWEMFFPVLVLYPIILFVFSKKYGWKHWKEKLFKKVHPPIQFKEDEFIA